jgi:hypothetical protein
LQADVAQVMGVPPELLQQMQASVLAALSSDTSSISGECHRKACFGLLCLFAFLLHSWSLEQRHILHIR